MPNSVDLKFDLPTDAEIKKMFDMAPLAQKYKLVDKVIRAGVKPVVKRAREKAPRAPQTDRDKRSTSQKQKANWAIELWTTIDFVIRKYARGGAGIIGPRWPDGNKAYFNTSPKGNRGHLWGYPGKQYPRKDGRTHTAAPAKARVQIRNWLVQAYDETKQEQLAAMKAEATRVTDQMMRGR